MKRFSEHINSYEYADENVFENNNSININIVNGDISKTNVSTIKNILESNKGHFGIKIICPNDSIKKLLLAVVIQSDNIFYILDNIINVLSTKNITHLPAIEMKMIRNMIEFEKL